MFWHKGTGRGAPVERTGGGGCLPPVLIKPDCEVKFSIQVTLAYFPAVPWREPPTNRLPILLIFLVPRWAGQLLLAEFSRLI